MDCAIARDGEDVDFEAVFELIYHNWAKLAIQSLLNLLHMIVRKDLVLILLVCIIRRMISSQARQDLEAEFRGKLIQFDIARYVQHSILAL